MIPHIFNQKRLFVIIVVIVVLLAVVSNMAWASTSFVPTADDFAVYDDNTSQLNIETLLNVRAGGSPDGTCASQNETFLKFDFNALDSSLVNLNTTITSAELQLTAASPSSGKITMELYGSSSDSWSEGNGAILQANRPPFDTNLNSTSPQVASGGTVTFASSTEFAKYAQDQLRGDGILTLAIRARSGVPGLCDTVGSPSQVMSARVADGGTSNPVLILSGTKGATAVTLTTLTAASAPTAPLALIAAVIGLTALALVWIRRR